MRTPRPGLTDASRRRIHAAAGSNPSDVGNVIPSEIDAHIGDSTIHRKQFRQWVQFTLPLDNARTMIGRAHKALTLKQLDSVVRGAVTPSVTWELRWATDLEGVVIGAVLGGVETTDEGPGQTLTAFDNSAIPEGAWMWVLITDVSGTVSELAVSIVLEEVAE